MPLRILGRLPPELVSCVLLAFTVILLAGVLIGGCSRGEQSEVSDDSATPPLFDAPATADASIQAAIGEAVQATIAAIPPAGTATPAPRPTVMATSTVWPVATSTPIPAPTFLYPNELQRVWNGYLAASEQWKDLNPRHQALIKDDYWDAFFVYRLTAAGQYDAMPFRDFLEYNDKLAGGFVNYRTYLRNEIDRMNRQNEWIGPYESLSDYAERMDFTRRSVDLAGFFSDNLEVEIVLRIYYGMSFDALERFSTPVFNSDRLSDAIDRLSRQNPLVLLSQEFARRDFDWWG